MKNLQSSSVTSREGRSVLPPLSRVSVSRLTPVDSATSVTVMVRPHSASFCFQNWNRVTLIDKLVLRYRPNIKSICPKILTTTQEYGIITSARFLSGSTTKLGFQAYFGQYTCPDCMFTQGPGSLEQSRGNSISQSGRSGKVLPVPTPPLNKVVTLGVILCLSKIYLILCVLHKSSAILLKQYISHDPHRLLTGRNRTRF